MREAMFIKKNVEKWNKYQHEPSADPDETAERFTTLIDDLSYAKTFYPRSKVTHWINGLAASIYQNVYQNKKEKYSRVFTFWKYELPFIFKKYHRIFLITTIMFVVFTTIGILMSIYNPEFIRSILGDGYVDMTEENIAKGDPFGVYSKMEPFRMFMHIFMNNTLIAVGVFLGGLLLGTYTLKMLWSTGMMMGAFQYMFFAHDLGIKSILTIWVHGTIELSSIVIASTAGFILANSLLFPGTFTRLESFKRGFKDACKLMIVLVPFFFTAAFLESYITRLMSRTYDSGDSFGMPVWVDLLILIGSLTLIVWYFVIWPIVLHKRGYAEKQEGIVNRLKTGND